MRFTTGLCLTLGAALLMSAAAHADDGQGITPIHSLFIFDSVPAADEDSAAISGVLEQGSTADVTTTVDRAIGIIGGILEVAKDLRDVKGSPNSWDDLEKANKAGDAMVDLHDLIKEALEGDGEARDGDRDGDTEAGDADTASHDSADHDAAESGGDHDSADHDAAESGGDHDSADHDAADHDGGGGDHDGGGGDHDGGGGDHDGGGHE